MIKKKLVYIASPYSGEIEKNVAFAKAACKYAIEQDCAPIAVHLIYPQLLDDGVPKERETGLQLGIQVLNVCDELWLCGETISEGMQGEWDAAVRRGLPVRMVSSDRVLPYLQHEEPEEEFPEALAIS